MHMGDHEGIVVDDNFLEHDAIISLYLPSPLVITL